jgi:hypothetical protein
VTTLFEDTTEFAALSDDLGAWNSSSSQFCAKSRGSESCLRLKLLVGELLISNRANQDLVRLPRRLRLVRARSRPV